MPLPSTPTGPGYVPPVGGPQVPLTSTPIGTGAVPATPGNPGITLAAPSSDGNGQPSPAMTIAGAATGAISSIYAAKLQAHAAASATAAQVGYENKALAAAKEAQQYQRGQYGSYLERLAPAEQAGGAALDRAGALIQ